MPLFSYGLKKDIFVRKLFKKIILYFSFKIDNITLDPDQNWAKIQDPDLNSIYLYPQHCSKQWHWLWNGRLCTAFGPSIVLSQYSFIIYKCKKFTKNESTVPVPISNNLDWTRDLWYRCRISNYCTVFNNSLRLSIIFKLVLVKVNMYQVLGTEHN